MMKLKKSDVKKRDCVYCKYYSKSTCARSSCCLDTQEEETEKAEVHPE